MNGYSSRRTDKERRGLSRRDWLFCTATGAGLAYVGIPYVEAVPWRALSPKPRSADDVRVAMVGLGAHGRWLLGQFLQVENCQVRYLCDPDRARAESAAKLVRRYTGHQATVVADMRRAFESSEVDAVVIATPNHWHALAAVWAMQAGKDVYLEKPVSHHVEEGAVLVRAAQRYGRIVQAGLQRRSYNELIEAIRVLHEGGIGTIDYARCLSWVGRPPIGAAHESAPPATVDFDLWCGPAPMETPRRRNFHYDWHWFWNFGGGGLANNGVHRLDVARWGMGLAGAGDSVMSVGGRFGEPDAGETPNTQVTLHRFGNRFIVHELRGLPSRPDPLFQQGDGIIFYGSDGILTFGNREARLHDAEGRFVRVHSANSGGNHARNFLAAVRAGSSDGLNCNVAEGHASSAMCHVGSISHRLGQASGARDIRDHLAQADVPDVLGDVFDRTTYHLEANEVRPAWRLGRVMRANGDATEIEGDAEATALLRGTYRNGYTLPDATPDESDTGS